MLSGEGGRADAADRTQCIASVRIEVGRAGGLRGFPKRAEGVLS